MIYSVIMAGGRGERFWPLSRNGRPKQLLQITSDKTMLEETIARMDGFVPHKQVRIITGENITAQIRKILPDIHSDHIYYEPFGRNTCLAIAVSALLLYHEDPNAIMIVLSSDHLIEPKDKLIEHLKVGAKICEEHDWLITIGVTPKRPETGYGYIKLGEIIETIGGISVYRVAEFNEKPSRVRAQQYYYDREHLWNSGMFIWSARSILKAMEKHKPDMFTELQKYEKAIGTDKEPEARMTMYQNMEDVSIDVAILEKANNVLTLKADIIWDDVGSWLSLDRIKKRDPDHNVIIGNTVNLGTFESIVYNDSDGLIATLGVSDLIIVRTDNIVMVAHKTRIGEIKKLLGKFGGRKELEEFL